jgi:DNA-binding Lrp family transcriptional regulator
MAIKDIPRQILSILEQDALTDPAQVAVMLGLTEEEVRAEIARLEHDGVIVKRKAFVNWEKAGVETVAALIEVKVGPQRNVGFDSIAERIARFPETRSLYLVSGTYDLQVQVVGRTMREVASFVSEKLAPLDGVQGTVTHFLMKRYKEDGELLEGADEAERLPLTP